MRKVLGDALYHVRLPTLSKKEFMEHVAKSDVLSDREARDLLTHFMETEPARPLPFPGNSRLGNAKIVEFPGSSVNTESLNFPAGTYLTLQFNNNKCNMSGLQAEISEVHFCNPADFPIDNVQIYTGSYTSCDKVEKVAGKLYCEYPVYRAIFHKPVSYSPYSHHAQVHFKTKTCTGVGTGALIHGNYYHEFTVNDRNVGLTLYGYNSTSWRFLVALKIKIQ